MKIAITADLHWGINPAGDESTLKLIDYLRNEPPDLLILAGDIGAGDEFERCLELFAGLGCRKSLVPGNHDIWVTSDDPRGDSWQVYSQHLPQLCERHGFHYLDHGPLLLTELGLAVAGTMNWYDYSWSIDQLPEFATDWEQRLRTKRFLRGRHYDARFVRWPFTDASFTKAVVERLEQHLAKATAEAGRTFVVTHHPAFEGLNYPSTVPPHLDQLLWKAFSGNRSVEKLIERYADRIAIVFSGHTHKERTNIFVNVPGYNIGGDYGWKRLLTVSWPELAVQTVEFRTNSPNLT